MRATASLLALASALALPLHSPAQEADPHVDAIRAASEQIDAGLKGARHIRVSAEAPFESGSWQEEHAWFDPDGRLLKVAAYGGVAGTVTHTDYYFRERELVFVFKTHETTPNVAKAPTQAEEERCYFAGGELVRRLVKTASFKAGVKPDMTKVANEAKPGDADGGYNDFVAEAQEIAQRLRGGANPDNSAAPADEKLDDEVKPAPAK